MSAVASADVAKPVPGQARALAVLSIGMLLGMTTWFSASAVVPQLRAEWALSATTAAWLTIAVQLGFVAGALVSGALNVADVFSPRTVFVSSAAAAAGVNALFVLSGGATTGIPVRFLTGFLLAGVYPPALKVMATWYRGRRGTALGIVVGALTLGSATPHLVNGLGGLPWRSVVLVTSALTVGGAAIVLMLGRDGPFPFPRARFDPTQAGRVFTDRRVRLASLGYFGHMWELYAMWAWFVVFLGESFAAHGGFGSRAAAVGTFAVIGSGALGCYLGGVLGDRWGRPEATALAMGVSGTCALIMGALFGRAPWLVLALGLVWGVSVVADSAQFSTLVSEAADQEYVGTALTLQLALGFTLTVATIWLVPIVRTAAGWWPAFAMLAAGPALGILAMLALRTERVAARPGDG